MVEIGYGRIRDIGGLPDLLLQLAGEEGLERVFHDQDIPLPILDTPDAVVPMKDIILLYHRASVVTGARSFGLKASSGLEPVDYGILCHYALQAPDLTGALKRFQAGLPYHETGSTVDLVANGNELRVAYCNDYQDLTGWRHGGDFTLCAMATLIGAYMGEGWRPLRVETCYTSGPWARDLEDMFNAPVIFDRDSMAITLEWEDAQCDNGPDRVRCGRMISLADVRRAGEVLPGDLPSMVSNIIERRLQEQNVDIEGTASALGLGPRTLQRRLSELGLSYRDLVLHCRMRRASELLTEPDAAIDLVALDVGYASTPQFHRAFKAYVGQTPTGYRTEQSLVVPAY